MMPERRWVVLARAAASLHLTILFWLIGCSNEDLSTSDPSRSGIQFFEVKESEHSRVPELTEIAKRENMILIQPGEFRMGSPSNEIGRKSDESIHTVRITYPFWIKKFEVSQKEWNLLAPMNDKKGALVFQLNSSILNQICTSSGYVGGHFSIEEFQENESTEIYLEEAVKASNQGMWESAKNPRNYKVNPQKFKDIDTLLTFLSSQKIDSIGRLNQLLPVSRVSYSQAVAFCWEKTQQERLNLILPSPLVYRLPTEAEWEYVCRAGTTGICGLGDGDYLSGENANIDGSIMGYTIDQRTKSQFSDGGNFVSIFRKKLLPIFHPAPAYPANGWGLHDMHGSVLEWCYDFYAPYPENNPTKVNPIGPIRGSYRIVRGGSFVRTAHESRSAARLSYEASYRGSEIGFRYVLGLPLR
jgi:formylglycine-generating enzyme required for sulfatase activity